MERGGKNRGEKSEDSGAAPAFVPPDGRQLQALQRRHDDVDVVVAGAQEAAVRVEPGVGGQPGGAKPVKTPQIWAKRKEIKENEGGGGGGGGARLLQISSAASWVKQGRCRTLLRAWRAQSSRRWRS